MVSKLDDCGLKKVYRNKKHPALCKNYAMYERVFRKEVFGLIPNSWVKTGDATTHHV